MRTARPQTRMEPDGTNQGHCSGEFLRQAAKCGRPDGCISCFGKQTFDRREDLKVSTVVFAKLPTAAEEDGR